MKNILMLSTLLIGFFVYTTASAAPAPKVAKAAVTGPNWVLLGSRTVNHGVDHDEIIVTARKGVYTGLRMHVKRAGIRLLTVRVVFGNGEEQKFAVNKVFTAGSYTGKLDLPGNKRIIRKVVFNYKTVAHRKVKAVIDLFGVK
jgi:hypothetical protein